MLSLQPAMQTQSKKLERSSQIRSVMKSVVEQINESMLYQTSMFNETELIQIAQMAMSQSRNKWRVMKQIYFIHSLHFMFSYYYQRASSLTNEQQLPISNLGNPQKK